MGVITYESEVSSPIPPARLFKAYVLDADNLIPKISPHTIKSTEIIEGNGGPGTIKKVTFHEGEYIFTNFSPNTFFLSLLKVLNLSYFWYMLPIFLVLQSKKMLVR